MARLVALDFETYYDRDYSLSKLTTEEYIRDPRFEVIGVSIKQDNGPAAWYSKPFVKAALEACEWEGVTLAHNAMFDGAILAWHYNIVPKVYADTLSMARPLHGMTCGVSLKALAQEYGIGEKGTEVEDALGKHYTDFTPAELEQYGNYCKNDVELTRALFFKLLPLTPRLEMLMIDQTIRLFTVPQLQLDRDKLTVALLESQERRAKLLARIEEVAGKDALTSAPKLASVLQSLGVEPPTKISPRTGKPAYAFAKTDKEFTDLLEHDDERVQAVVAARLGVKSTNEEKRTERLISIANRGPLPVPLSYAGAVVTTRHAGTDKINLQNLNRGSALRKAITAPAGHVLVVGDSANIELRVSHTLAGQADTVQALRNHHDLYCEFASVLYGRPITKDDDPDERFLGKLAMLSLQYGAGAERFREMCRQKKVKLTEEEAARIVGTWRETYDKIPALWKRADRAIGAMVRGECVDVDPAGLVVTGECCLVTPPDNRIRYPGLCDEGGGYTYQNRKQTVRLHGPKCVENLCQHIARNILAEQWIQIANHYPVVLQVHDELVVVAPEAEAEDAKQFMLEVMRTSPAWWPDLPLDAEVHYAFRYGDAK